MKTFITLLLVVVGCLISGCQTQTTQKSEPKKEKRYKERHYQLRLCKEIDGIVEKVLPDKTRVDCLTSEYAVEVDFAKKWAESVGQSLYYAKLTGKKPAVGLIVGESKGDQRNLRRFRVLAREYHIKLFILKKGE
jgi:hypothetical protein